MVLVLWHGCGTCPPGLEHFEWYRLLLKSVPALVWLLRTTCFLYLSSCPKQSPLMRSSQFLSEHLHLKDKQIQINGSWDSQRCPVAPLLIDQSAKIGPYVSSYWNSTCRHEMDFGCSGFGVGRIRPSNFQFQNEHYVLYPLTNRGCLSQRLTWIAVKYLSTHLIGPRSEHYGCINRLSSILCKGAPFPSCIAMRTFHIWPQDDQRLCKYCIRGFKNKFRILDRKHHPFSRYRRNSEMRNRIFDSLPPELVPKL